MDIEQVIAMGVKLGQIHFLDSNGYVAGATGTAASGANGSPMVRLIGIQSASVTVPEGENVSIPGDDTTLGTFPLDSTETPTFNLDVGVENFAIASASQSTNVVDDGDISYMVLQPDQPTYRDALLLLSSDDKSFMPDTRGLSGWYHYCVPKVTMRYLGRVAIESRQGAAFRYQCTVNFSTTRGAGATMKTSVEGTEAATLIPMTSTARLTIQRWVGDGVTTVWNLDKRPYSTDLAYNRVRVNGNIQLSGVTISQANKTMTISPAVGVGVPIVSYYEWVPG